MGAPPIGLSDTCFQDSPVLQLSYILYPEWMRQNAGTEAKMQIRRKKQKEALAYALGQIQKSSLAPYIQDVILFGSCAKGTEKYKSDVDLLVEVKDGVLSMDQFHKEVFRLKGAVSPPSLQDAEVDLKIVSGEEWRGSDMLFCKNVRKDGVSVWH